MNAAIVRVMLFFSDRFAGRKDRGATAVEYGLLVGLIAVAIILTLVALGPKLNDLFQTVLTKLPAKPA